jgi:RNase H-like domain found in reverse transcriptase/Integrase zinc binding domain
LWWQMLATGLSVDITDRDYKTMRPARFHSRSLNPAKRNYPTHGKEMLAIVDCLKKWEPILTGTLSEILTDHAPLTHWKTQKDLSPCQIRWRYWPAMIQTFTTFLPSRTVQPTPCPDIGMHSKAVKPMTVLRQGWISTLSRPSRLMGPSTAPFGAQNHFGVAKTRAAISRDYFWPGVTRDVETYIRYCEPCAHSKSSTQAPRHGYPLPVPDNGFMEIAMDFIWPLPMSCRFDCILVMTDRLTSYMRIEPLRMIATAPEVANLFHHT